VLGIATIVFREGQNLNFAISGEAIRVAVLSGTVEDKSSGKTAAGEPAITLNHSPNEPNDSALIFKLDRALSAHDWATVSTYVADGVIDYFGHRNASPPSSEKIWRATPRRIAGPARTQIALHFVYPSRTASFMSR